MRTVPSNKTTDDFVFFWGSHLSQWYNTDMYFDGVMFNCAEQFMMWAKARTFNDQESMAKILEAKDPSKQKALGRRVENFNELVWDEHKLAIVTTGNMLKYTQNPDIMLELVDTEDREIVEASPEDSIWGIGMDVNHPDILDKTKWQGQNLLGEALMKVRSIIREI